MNFFFYIPLTSKFLLCPQNFVLEGDIHPSSGKKCIMYEKLQNMKTNLSCKCKFCKNTITTTKRRTKNKELANI